MEKKNVLLKTHELCSKFSAGGGCQKGGKMKHAMSSHLRDKTMTVANDHTQCRRSVSIHNNTQDITRPFCNPLGKDSMISHLGIFPVLISEFRKRSYIGTEMPSTVDNG